MLFVMTNKIWYQGLNHVLHGFKVRSELHLYMVVIASYNGSYLQYHLILLDTYEILCYSLRPGV
jgi:hypothetical protein